MRKNPTAFLGNDSKHLTLAFVLILVAFIALTAAKCDIDDLERRVGQLESSR